MLTRIGEIVVVALTPRCASTAGLAANTGANIKDLIHMEAVKRRAKEAKEAGGSEAPAGDLNATTASSQPTAPGLDASYNPALNASNRSALSGTERSTM